jgi:N6-adenosine-specific RNA methylase IME4
MIDPPAAGRYSVVYADPPWPFRAWSARGKGRSAEAHFDCMSLEEIKALPVARWAARNAVLYLWATVPHLELVLGVIPAWGFGYKSNLAWIKERGGTGYWAKNRHELLLIGVRGSRVCPRFHDIPIADSVIEGGQRQFARKPDAARAIIDRYHPNAHRLELFARETAPGWDAWGDQVGLLDHGPVSTRRRPSGSPKLAVRSLSAAACGRRPALPR